MYCLYCIVGQANIFFSAHGVPVAYVEEAGDPYKAEMEECVALIMDELRRRGVPNEHTLAYQVCKSTPYSIILLHNRQAS